MAHSYLMRKRNPPQKYDWECPVDGCAFARNDVGRVQEHLRNVHKYNKLQIADFNQRAREKKAGKQPGGFDWKCPVDGCVFARDSARLVREHLRNVHKYNQLQMAEFNQMIKEKKAGKQPEGFDWKCPVDGCVFARDSVRPVRDHLRNVHKYNQLQMNECNQMIKEKEAAPQHGEGTDSHNTGITGPDELVAPHIGTDEQPNKDEGQVVENVGAPITTKEESRIQSSNFSLRLNLPKSAKDSTSRFCGTLRATSKTRNEMSSDRCTRKSAGNGKHVTKCSCCSDSDSGQAGTKVKEPSTSTYRKKRAAAAEKKMNSNEETQSNQLMSDNGQNQAEISDVNTKSVPRAGNRSRQPDSVPSEKQKVGQLIETVKVEPSDDEMEVPVEEQIIGSGQTVIENSSSRGNSFRNGAEIQFLDKDGNLPQLAHRASPILGPSTSLNLFSTPAWSRDRLVQYPSPDRFTPSSMSDSSCGLLPLLKRKASTSTEDDASDVKIIKQETGNGLHFNGDNLMTMYTMMGVREKEGTIKDLQQRNYELMRENQLLKAELNDKKKMGEEKNRASSGHFAVETGPNCVEKSSIWRAKTHPILSQARLTFDNNLKEIDEQINRMANFKEDGSLLNLERAGKLAGVARQVGDRMVEQYTKSADEMEAAINEQIPGPSGNKP